MSTSNQRFSSMPPGILDSPTLARVERAILRHEQDVVLRNGGHREHTQSSIPYQQSLLSNYGREGHTAIKRGLLWQQRGKMFSRWKERYFILTRDYLHCFRRASGADRISDMGQFLFKIKLMELTRVEWENKKTYSTVALILDRDNKIYLRASDGLEDWFELLEECTLISKERRRNQRFSVDSKAKDVKMSSSFDNWIAARQKIPTEQKQYTDTVSTNQNSVKEDCWLPSEDESENPIYNNRLSLLTDIDINAYDTDTLEAISVTSYRMSEDILCIQPPYLRVSGSFRSSREPVREVKRPKEVPPEVAPQQLIKFRERSYSDIQRVDRRQWRARYNGE
ncbi:uncharacterized protein [Onthophagus taurus]|uniref:uncharacterized protein n=1 Tax=Onthophagus taurus TaxID=166361 RepID=UPI000C2080AD|nr:uncharacterized protein LOC111427869 [Onthophagus taurus]